jgi:carbamoyl-phosphate synthase small subunit
VTTRMADERTEAGAALMLADGRRFDGRWLVEPGPHEVAVGEVVFNTAMTGYQEIVTDPSYAGQIVVLTYPLIGSYGAAAQWTESARPQVRGLVVHRMEEASHWEATDEFLRYLRQHRVPVLTGTDTRALTRRLRDLGTQVGALYSLQAIDGPDGAPDPPETVRAAIQRFSLAGIVDTVTARAAYTVPAGDGAAGHRPTVAVIDYGLKSSIVDEITRRGMNVVVLPATARPDDLDRLRPDGVVLSNGPGDPTDLVPRLDLVRRALDGYPTLGICLGHQLVALAAGGQTFALKFGHHGSNHPVRDAKTGRVDITTHNHGYAVDPKSLPLEYQVRFVNLNDGTVEGLEHRSRPVLTVQHHPEAGPGPHDATGVFDEFSEQVLKEWNAAHA